MSVLDTIKEENPTIYFYKQFVKYGLKEFTLWDKLRADYFAKNLKSNELYKFISFSSDDSLNDNKLSTLENRCLWFAPHHVFVDNDATEFNMSADLNIVAQKTGYTKEYINSMLTAIRDINDICCLSDRISEYMWENYANRHMGICCVFDVITANDLWPVLYCDKSFVDFTYEIISGLNNNEDSSLCLQTLAFISPVLKDKSRYRMENEVRLLNGEAYFGGENSLGTLEPNKKESLPYFGRKVPWDSYGLSLKKIIIGKNTPNGLVDRISKMSLNCIMEDERI